MKFLYDCDKNTRVRVLKLNADTELKQRFISFGIMKGSVLEVVQHTVKKSTVEIKVGKMKIALRDSEAKLIEVEVI